MILNHCNVYRVGDFSIISPTKYLQWITHLHGIRDQDVYIAEVYAKNQLRLKLET